MDLKEIVSVSGLSGLHKVVAQRQDGLIIQELGSDKSKFLSNRSHVFTPLDGITIYTETDSAELATVLWAIKQQEKENPVPEKNADDKTFREYFGKILTDFDKERVYTSDIKKLIKWYAILDAHKLITEPKEEDKEEEGAEGETKTKAAAEVKTQTKKKKAKPKKAIVKKAPTIKSTNTMSKKMG